MAPAVALAGWVVKTSRLPLPATPVAVKVIGLPVRPVEVAVSELLPAVVPRVQLVTCAMPLGLVVTALAGLTLPPPEATAKVTLAPDTGLLNWSRTITDGGIVTAVFTCRALGVAGVDRHLCRRGRGAGRREGERAAGEAGRRRRQRVGAGRRAEGPAGDLRDALALVVIAVVGFTVPPTDVTAKVTLIPGTGLPNWSFTIADGAVVTAVLTVALWALPPLITICVAAPTRPVAVKVTGLPARPVEVAVSVLAPAVWPSVQLPAVAMPLLPVVAAPPVTLPPPLATAKVTLTLWTGLLNWSRTITDGAVVTAVFTVADWASPALEGDLGRRARVTGSGKGQRAAGQAARRRGQRVGAGRLAQRPAADRRDAVAAGGGRATRQAAAAARHREGDAGARRDRVVELVAQDDRRCRGDGGVHRRRLGVARVDRDLRRGCRRLPVAVKVTGLPVRPVTVAVMVLAPAAWVSVQLETVAIPLLPVVPVVDELPPRCCRP